MFLKLFLSLVVVDLSVAISLDASSPCYLSVLLDLCRENAQCVDGACVCRPPWTGDNCDDDSDIYGTLQFRIK